MRQREWHNVEDAAAIRGGVSLAHGIQMRKIAEKLSM
jgi:hypothetical protein